MFVHHRTKAIVFKRVDRGESDQLFTLYTKKFGKINVFAKGVRKIFSKLKPSIDLFQFIEIEFVRGKANNTLIGVNSVDKFEKIHQNLSKLSTAQVISAVLDELITDKEKENNLWDFILHTFQDLDGENFTTTSIKVFYYWFLWKLFSLLGYKPELYRCARGSETLKPRELHFNSEEGGVICSECFGLVGGLDSSAEIIKMLRVLVENDWPRASKLKIDKEQLRSLDQISEDYLSYFERKKRFE